MSKVGDKLGIEYELTVRNIYYEDNGVRLLKCINSKEKNRLEAVIEFDSEIYDVPYLLESTDHIKGMKEDGIPQVYDVFGDKETTYVSTEFISGSDLEEYFNEYSVEYDDKIQLINIIGTAISYIHKYNDEILFDKINPKNIVVTESGLVYLLEYGFTRYMKLDALYQVSCNAYTAPELRECYDVTRVLDFRSDVYSFGGLIYYILTEKEPHKKNMLPDDLPEGLRKIIMKCMDIDMNSRYDSIDDVLKDIKRL